MSMGACGSGFYDEFFFARSGPVRLVCHVFIDEVGNAMAGCRKKKRVCFDIGE